MGEVDFPVFQPHPLLRNPHAQTIFATYVTGAEFRYEALRRVVQLGDGDRLVLHDDRPSQWRTGDRVVVLLHGIGGCYLSSYMVRIGWKLYSRGVRTFRMDLRGHGAGMAMARSIGHAGRSEDVAAVVKYLSRTCTESPISLIGFSKSGNIVLKYLGEMSNSVPKHVASAVAVAPPIDLLHCGKNLRRGVRRVYDQAFVRHLHRLVRRRQRTIPDLKEVKLDQLPNRLWQFDDQFTARLSGFAGVEDYYTKCSAGPLLASICIPTLILVAEDDPLIPVSMFDRFSMSPTMTLYRTSHGGHLGFIGIAGVDPDRRWMDWRMIDWIEKTVPIEQARHGPLSKAVSLES